MTIFRNVHRRTFLRGLGTAMALPVLEAMRPVRSAFAAPAAVQAPVRMAFVFFPNGAIEREWRADGNESPGSLACTGRTLAPLCDHERNIVVFEGLAQHHGRANGDGAGDHARNASVYLTGAQPLKTSGGNIKVGTSVDQAAAAEIGDRTRLPSLEVGTVQGRNAGGCDSGYSCAYSSNISWKSPTTPTAKEINPKLVFERLFGNSNVHEQEAARAKRAEYRQSILDLVADDARRLEENLGKTDRQKLDEYFTSVRELEERIGRAANSEPVTVPEFDVPAGIPRDHGQHVDLMYDLLALAFQTDTTRIATFMLENAGANRSYPEAEVNAGWHELSHHQNDRDKMDRIQRIDEWYVKRFARFLDTLAAIDENGSTLLDNSMIVYGSAIGDGNRHTHHDLPIVLAGKGGGTITTGRKLVYPRDTPLNNLFVSMTDRMGCRIETLGDSKGRLANLA